jgi:hypothetical protein
MLHKREQIGCRVKKLWARGGGNFIADNFPLDFIDIERLKIEVRWGENAELIND